MKKEIKGTPMYILRGDSYFERPKGTRCVKMRYDEDEDVTFITVKKNFYFLEVLAVLTAITAILFTTVLKPQVGSVAMYSTPIEWYDGNLNINLMVDNENHFPVEYDINGTTGLLLPGENLYKIPCDVKPESVNVKLTTRFLFLSDTSEETVQVYDLSDER